MTELVDAPARPTGRKLDGEMREEGVHLGFGQRLRVAELVEADEAFGPVVVSVLGANRVVPHAAGDPQAIEEPGRLGGNNADRFGDWRWPVSVYFQPQAHIRGEA